MTSIFSNNPIQLRPPEPNSPMVSVCLPNLNTFPFLRERIESIKAQTCQDWELVVSDNYSEDGAWEFFQAQAQRDRRIKIAQAPREGMYQNWNRCVTRACGRYVYMATSDDNMAPDCLDKLVRALESHPEAGMAHCPVHIIDENGAPAEDPLWPDCTSFVPADHEWLKRRHIRRAPYDGFLHLLGKHVYLSFTQLLIRRSLFAKVGAFPAQWGSMSDFNWEMRASLVADTIHVPDTWAGWRVHKKQATDLAAGVTLGYQLKNDQMIIDAVDAMLPQLDSNIARGLATCWQGRTHDMKTYYRGLRYRPTAARRRLFQLTQFLTGTNAVRAEILGQLTGKPKWPDIAHLKMRAWLENLRGVPMLEASP